METIRDDTQRMVCFLFMRECAPEDICRALKISGERLELVRAAIAWFATLSNASFTLSRILGLCLVVFAIDNLLRLKYII